ncbi:rod shape-determining protein MreC [Conexibacter woesei]|uniref:rod shape-determining protein MreC n=1 Tax=Conexibacter woesei TaxID=191495 RepID=UPI000325DDE6|nr:rod shape-determining protein MreC [Conexibacter woesei]
MVSLILLTAYFGESPGSPLHSVQRGVINVLSPIQEGASRALKPARDLFGWFGDTLDAKKERDQLRAQRDALLRRQIAYDVAIEENEELRGLVAMRRTYDLSEYQPVTARIIARSPNNLFRDTMQVDAGSGSGVHVGDAVIADGGLVGHISTAAGGTAIVTLITDLRSTVSGRLLNGRGDYGLVRPSIGDPLDLLMQQLRRDTTAREGDVVVTSGTIADRLESPYPPKIPIGRVTRVDEAELDSQNQIHVAPIADLRHLDFVQILTSSPSGEGERAQVP